MQSYNFFLIYIYLFKSFFLNITQATHSQQLTIHIIFRIGNAPKTRLGHERATLWNQRYLEPKLP